MNQQHAYSAHLAEQYIKSGWEPLDPEEAHRDLNFLPDLFLKRGDERLVVEVRPAGSANSRALDTIRRLIESFHGWHFEIKLIPGGWGESPSEPEPSAISSRLRLSEDLIKDGHWPEAYILIWTSIEALIRKKVLPENAQPMSDNSLIRYAFENELISIEQLQILENGLKRRNKLIHGMSIEMSRNDAFELLKLASQLSKSASMTN